MGIFNSTDVRAGDLHHVRRGNGEEKWKCNLISVGRAKDKHVGQGTERLKHLNRLMSRAVFTEPVADEESYY